MNRRTPRSALAWVAAGSLIVAAGCSTQRAPDAPLASTQDPTLSTTTTNTTAHRSDKTRAEHADNAHNSWAANKSDTARAHDGRDDSAVAPRAVDGTTTTAVPGTSTPAAAVDRASQSEATGGGPVAADNTGVNTRDRHDNHLTPMDQGGSEADRTTTQKIRQAVVGDKALSFNAKNVKIITVNGKVTLRGPVKSDAERASIEAKAREVAGSGQVDNQLEIKP